MKWLKKNWKRIGRGAILLIVLFFFVVGIVVSYNAIFAKPPVATPAEEAVQEASADPTVNVFVETLGYDGHMITAHFVAPEGWTVYWKNGQGEILAIVSEEESIAGVMGIYLSPAEAKGVYPELVSGEHRVKGKPIP